MSRFRRCPNLPPLSEWLGHGRYDQTDPGQKPRTPAKRIRVPPGSSSTSDQHTMLCFSLVSLSLVLPDRSIVARLLFGHNLGISRRSRLDSSDGTYFCWRLQLRQIFYCSRSIDRRNQGNSTPPSNSSNAVPGSGVDAVAPTGVSTSVN